MTRVIFFMKKCLTFHSHYNSLQFFSSRVFTYKFFLFFRLQHRLSILESELNSFKAQQSQLLSTIEQQEKQINQINENAKRQQEVDAKSYEKFKQELEMQNEKVGLLFSTSLRLHNPALF